MGIKFLIEFLGWEELGRGEGGLKERFKVFGRGKGVDEIW